MPEAPPRWRVLLVRYPPDGAERIRSALPGQRPVARSRLPLVTRVTADQHAAIQTARRLRKAGATALIVEDPSEDGPSAFCPSHHAHLAAGDCKRCGAPICERCRLEANGESLCTTCNHTRNRSRRNLRLRQLFFLFLFTAFIYEVYQYLHREGAKVSPDGPVDVALMQFVPPAASNAPIVRLLNGEHVDGYQGQTLADIGAWFDAEHYRYTHIGGPYLRIHIRGPWPVKVEPPKLATPDDSWWKLAWRSWNYARYFTKLGERYGVTADGTGVRLFVVYGNDDSDLASHSRSTAKGHLSIAFVSLDERNPAYALATICHELAHALGAEDTYNPATSLARYPVGYVEPYARPLYPQRYAEIMAVDIPLSPETEAEIHSLDQERVGYHTAALMRWIDPARAELFYTPPSETPLSRVESQNPAPRHAGGDLVRNATTDEATRVNAADGRAPVTGAADTGTPEAAP